MFTHASSVDRKEATYLIKEIMSAIKKISSSRQILAVVSWNQYQSSYNHVLLSRLDKYIEITST
jgi:predicted phosphatase